MKSEKKIFLERAHDLNEVTKFLKNNTAEKVVLNIPKNSVLGVRLNNFQVLKREGAAAGKELVIESIDEHILELAGLAGIEAFNPFFRTRGRVVSDILPRGANLPKPLAPKIEEENEEAMETPEEKPLVIKSFFDEPKIKIKKIPRKRSSTGKVFRFVLTFAVFILGGFGIFQIASNILPRAEITVTLKKIPVVFNENVQISSAALSPNFAGEKIVLPGELLTAKQNVEMIFPASKHEKVEEKARGFLAVYNAYSSSPQILVKSTRFESPEKKIFRLEKQVTIPGAKLIDDKIVPSKIEVEVIADEVGETYNVPASSQWRIPGFAGTPRYEGFYAEAVNPITGGFVGEKAVPSEDDIKGAKEKIRGTLEAALKNQMFVLLRDKFKFLDGAVVFKITKEEIKTDVGDGKFGIFTEGEMRELVFEEETLKQTISEKAKNSLASDLPSLKIFDFKLDYGSPEINLDEGKINVSVTGSIVYGFDVNGEKIIEDAVGRSEESLKAMIFSLPGLEGAKISLWPFWVKKVPDNLSRVKFTVE